MQKAKKIICLLISLLTILSSLTVFASAESEELYNLLILEDEKFTQQLANTALTAANVGNASLRDQICMYLNIKASFPGVLAKNLTKANADAAVTALKNAGYNNCYAAKMKMGENITWDMKDAKITLTGTGATYDYGSSSNRTPLYFTCLFETDKNGELVKAGEKNKSIMGNTSSFSIEVGEGITGIGIYAFRYVSIDDCDPHTPNIGPSVTLPSTLETISKQAFAYSEAESINIPDNVTFIDDGAFWDTRLGSVYIPKKAKLKGNVFANARVTSISVNSDNPYYTVVDGVLYSRDGKALISYPQQKETEAFKVPNGVKTLVSKAFFDNQYICSIKLPQSVETIEDYCFDQSTLERIYITSALSKIGRGAFECATYYDEYNHKSCNYFSDVYYEKGTNLDSISVDINNEPFEKATKTEANPYPEYTDCMVSFDCGDADSIPAFKMVTKGSKVSKPSDPVCAGNNFLGWYEDSSYSKAFDFNNAINSNTTVYAKFESDISKTVTSIKAKTLNAKTEFNKGDTFVTTGLVITVKYSDTTSEDITDGFTTSTPNMTQTGLQTVTVMYKGSSTTYYITINDNTTPPTNPVEVKNVSLPGNSSSYKNFVIAQITCKSADYIKVNGTKYTLTDGKANVEFQQLTDSKAITIEAYKGDDLTIKATGTINVPNGFFDKVSSFFSYLFGGFKYKTTTISYTL